MHLNLINYSPSNLKLPKAYSPKCFEKKEKDFDLKPVKVSSFEVSPHCLHVNVDRPLGFIHWQNQWKNFHLVYKSILVQKLMYDFFAKKKLYINKFYYHKYHGGLRLVGHTFGFYQPKLVKRLKKLKPKTRLVFLPFLKKKGFQPYFAVQALQKKKHPTLSKKKNYSFGKKISFRKNTNKNNKKTPVNDKNFKSQHKLLKDFYWPHKHHQKLKSLQKAISNYTFTPKVSLCLTHNFLPKNYILDNANLSFKRYQSIQNFWEGLQLMRIIVERKAMSHLLAKFIRKSVRRNPKRAAFLVYIKRIIDWHFATTTNLLIQGLRIEAKGRFNAKSRSRKYILSVGRVAKEEKTSHVDYSFLESYTIFGSLGIKVWVCPLKKENVITTT